MIQVSSPVTLGSNSSGLASAGASAGSPARSASSGGGGVATGALGSSAGAGVGAGPGSGVGGSSRLARSSMREDPLYVGDKDFKDARVRPPPSPPHLLFNPEENGFV